MAAPRIVAELGRPETPDETADRKAAASRAYRSSQTFRNLAAAMLVTVAVVAVIILGVPRGETPAEAPIDVAARAETESAPLGRTFIVPTVPADWLVNGAGVEYLRAPAWSIVYATPNGFVRVAQGLTTRTTWPSQLLDGSDSTEQVTIDGIVWDVYALTAASSERGISYAIATDAGDSVIVIYGRTDADTAEIVARAIANDIRTLREDTP